MLRIQPGVLLLSDRGEQVQVGSWLGEGSYARVYRATLPDGKGPCALKIAKPEVPDSAQWLAAERRVLEAVRHPHLVELLGSGCAEASSFLLLEWLEGEALHDLIRARRRLPVRQALELLESLAAAVAAIHARGMVHGDIRAQNVLVVPRRGAMLIDPGLGDPALLGDSPAGRDVRCLGELLHLMVTGAPPLPDRAVLATANGFSRPVVELWTRTQSAAPPAAAEFQQQVGRVRGAL